jgi:hypothetical protein
MSGIEAIGIIVSAIPIVTRVVKHFGTPRNAPRQVERLSRILSELQDERLVQAAMPEEQKTIANLLNRCTDLFERETTGHKSRTWKFFWSLDAEKQLKEHNDEIELELDRIQRRVHMFAMQVPTFYPRVYAGTPCVRRLTLSQFNNQTSHTPLASTRFTNSVPAPRTEGNCTGGQCRVQLR